MNTEDIWLDGEVMKGVWYKDSHSFPTPPAWQNVTPNQYVRGAIMRSTREQVPLNLGGIEDMGWGWKSFHAITIVTVQS